MTWVDEAVEAGASKWRACEEVGISVRSYQRWLASGEVKADGRPTAVRPVPSNALTAAEREQVLAVCNSPAYSSLPPSQIVPRLADEGIYLASESTMYRVLKSADQQHHRGRAKARRTPGPAQTHKATGANQVWSWDITYGVFQASCRVLRYAAFFSLCSVVGFSVTSLMRCQLRVLPDQRSGWHCCAA